MHNLIHLAALLALSTTSTLAVEFKFRRFSQPDCNEKFHIAKDTHLHDPHCKTFDHHEPPFESFMAIAEEHQGDVREKFCEVVVFDQPECKGQGYTMAGESFFIIIIIFFLSLFYTSHPLPSLACFALPIPASPSSSSSSLHINSVIHPASSTLHHYPSIPLP
ncbi:hypothetical protein KC315_g13121 [Hortaea werneckii]|nr:hypothetical protein KC315_g13121 [Hortaea werneckii]KAI7315137.1 hypothetical protein KC340_g9091 [Hortaea werneckii]